MKIVADLESGVCGLTDFGKERDLRSLVCKYIGSLGFPCSKSKAKYCQELCLMCKLQAKSA